MVEFLDDHLKQFRRYCIETEFNDVVNKVTHCLALKGR